MANNFLRPISLQSDGELHAGFERFSDQCQETFGHRICTIFSWSLGDIDCIRVWSSQPEAYPFPNRKPMGPTDWGEAVLYRKEAWEALTFPEVERAFFDHRIISSLGCGCCLSAPILVDDEVIGAASILDVEGRYVRGDAKRFVELMPMLLEPLRGL